MSSRGIFIPNSLKSFEKLTREKGSKLGSMVTPLSLLLNQPERNRHIVLLLILEPVTLECEKKCVCR